MELSRGSYIAERYQIIDDARDAGSVYLAEDRSNSLGSLQVLVSLRVLDKKLFNLIQLEDKVKSLRAIQHENIIRIFDLIKGPELLAVSTERISGMKLSLEMETTIYSSFDVVTKLVQISKGIEALHDSGIIHGALDEDCVFVCEDGSCKIDPLVPNSTNKFDSSSDIKALGEIGLKLATAALYQPSSFLLKRHLNAWKKHISQDTKLLDLIGRIQKGKGGIRYFRGALEKLLYDRDLNSQSTACITYVLNANTTLFIFLTILVTLLTFLCLIALSADKGATLSLIDHLIVTVYK